MSDVAKAVAEAAALIAQADALLIGAGAGMGVDSGLPDFRGDHGFWKAYPAFQGRSFASMSNPAWFERDPALAWGFFGHRTQLYRACTPHRGFAKVLAWGQRAPAGFFVFTSNVDGQFHKAGYPGERILECHGSIHHLQCTLPCTPDVWPAPDVALDIDVETVRARSELPRCPHCGAIARPNVLMFNDLRWLCVRFNAQAKRYAQWLKQAEGLRIVAIEMGAGLAIPTVRLQCESAARAVIRINPTDFQMPPGGVSLPLPAAEAIDLIDQRL
jgi:NAD-dependent SIR2 family protein deacetylase